MNLSEHKRRLHAYEELLTEIEALKIAARSPTTCWNIDIQVSMPKIGDYRTGVPIDAELAVRTIREFIGELEKQACAEAATLGLDA